MMHAPKGGAFFLPTGSWYEGGQFMPTCDEPLPKGSSKKVREVAAKRTDKTGNISQINVYPFAYSLQKTHAVNYVMAGETYQRYAFAGTFAQCVEFAKQVLEKKSADYVKRGLLPHPTQLVVNN
jgi:hypothetical protein